MNHSTYDSNLTALVNYIRRDKQTQIQCLDELPPNSTLVSKTSDELHIIIC